MDVLFDYRPALVQRTGVGEYVHELAGALARTAPPGCRLHLFSSSRRDRLSVDGDLVSPAVVPHDHTVPVRVLHWLWHRAGWPPVERLTGGAFDVTHAAHPLIVPSRSAASIVTVHDLDFLDHPERAAGEVRRDYPSLAASHARRSDAVLVSSHATAALVAERLEVPPDRIVVARAGVPSWVGAGRMVPRPPAGPILFVGTLEPRKNVGALLDAYVILCDRGANPPPLVLAGRHTPAADAWLRRIREPPLEGRVQVLGYVPDAERRRLFEGASVLVMPSWNEGFGMPVLEALALGVPVVASNRGSLPEVGGDAVLYCDPATPASLAQAIAHALGDERETADRVARGLARVRGWSWDATGTLVWRLYQDLVQRRRQRRAHRD